MQDWFVSMMDYEKVWGAHYGIDCKGGRVEVFNLDDNDTVGFFTADQAKVFFDGLNRHKYDNEKLTFSESEEAIREMSEIIPHDYLRYYRVRNNQMTSCECYCYLKEVMAIAGKSR